MNFRILGQLVTSLSRGRLRGALQCPKVEKQVLSFTRTFSRLQIFIIALTVKQLYLLFKTHTSQNQLVSKIE